MSMFSIFLGQIFRINCIPVFCLQTYVEVESNRVGNQNLNAPVLATKTYNLINIWGMTVYPFFKKCMPFSEWFGVVTPFIFSYIALMLELYPHDDFFQAFNFLYLYFFKCLGFFFFLISLKRAARSSPIKVIDEKRHPQNKMALGRRD